MRQKLNRDAARRERNRQRSHSLAVLGRLQSDRMRAKVARQEAYVDQVTLDHEQGLEHGHIARKAYREKCAARHKAPIRPVASARKDGPRPLETYRWARKKLARGAYRSLSLKAARTALGLARPEMDRLRRQQAQEAKASA